MARRGPKPQVRYWDSKGGYYTSFGGRDTPLAKGPDDGPTGPTFLKALEVFRRVVAGEEVPSEGRQPSDTVGAVVRQWIEHRGAKAPSSCYTDTFLAKHGGKKVSELLPIHVAGWLQSQDTWGSTTKFKALSTIKTALSWHASNTKTVSPLEGMKAPEGVEDLPRGAQYRLPDDLIVLLLKTARGRFRDYLLAIHQTGARPGEISNAQPFHYDRANRRLVFHWNPRKGYVWKNARKTKKDRWIYLTDELVAIVERNIAAGSDWLFPTRQKDGQGCYRRYSKDNAGTCMWKLRNQEVIQQHLRENGIDEEIVICYALRHSYASAAIDRGVNMGQLAVLLGTSVRMLEKVYCHHDGNALRAVFDQITKK